MKENPSPYQIGEKVLFPFLDHLSLKRKWIVISDETVFSLYGETLIAWMKKKGFSVSFFTFPGGEKSKSREQKEKIEDFLFLQNSTRKDGLIALGGGVTLDLVGFVASTYLRGIDYISIPTSLLAMIDACIGGKTGINTPFGKNLVGSFYPAIQVCVDTCFLSTLTQTQMKEGFCEGIKHAVVADSSFWKWIQKNGEKVLSKDPEELLFFIEKNQQIKKSIVLQDEKEQNVRKKLNFGHTIGHALEKASSYTLSHGKAIAWGMLLEANLAKKEGYFPEEEYLFLQESLKTFKLLSKLPKLDPSIIEQALLHDKKNDLQKVGVVMLQSLGSCIPDVIQYFPVEKIMDLLDLPLVCLR